MDQFQDQIEKALDELADDRIDQGIDLWETTFSQAEPYLSTEDGLMLKQEYAIILQHVGAIEKARKVDAWIEEALEKDEEEGNEEVSSHFRNKLLENVARRWNLPVQPAEENDVDDNIADSKNGGLESDAITTVLELQPVVEQPLQRAQRGQSLTIPERPAELGNQSVEKPNHSMVSEERTAKVESSSHLSPARPTLQGADLSSDQAKAQWWYFLLEDKTHNFMYGKDSKFFGKRADGQSYAPVRIAVLDNGIAHTKKVDKSAMKKYWGHVQGYATFIDGEKAADALIDESGHGTAVAVQFMKTCPTAEIFIGRVARCTDGELTVDKNAVERAIYASIDPNKWGVDIINMSFGWDYNDHPGVSKAIAAAKAQGVLMFASTSNYGLTTTNDILYPALADEVISIDAADGTGEPAAFNPSSVLVPGKERFCAPGAGLSTPISEELVSGTSFASPIAAGVAALVLEFARQTPLADSPSVSACLHQRHGMVLILRAMSKRKGVDNFQFLCPWEILADPDGIYGGDGHLRSRRYFVAQDIVYRLRKGFGRNIGDDIFPIV